MELLTLAGINVAVAFAAFLRRQNAALAQRFEAFSQDITGIDRRLARLEGWIERGRGGHSPDQA